MNSAPLSHHALFSISMTSPCSQNRDTGYFTPEWVLQERGGKRGYCSLNVMPTRNMPECQLARHLFQHWGRWCVKGMVVIIGSRFIVHRFEISFRVRGVSKYSDCSLIRFRYFPTASLNVLLHSWSTPLLFPTWEGDGAQCLVLRGYCGKSTENVLLIFCIGEVLKDFGRILNSALIRLGWDKGV